MSTEELTLEESLKAGRLTARAPKARPSRRLGRGLTAWLFMLPLICVNVFVILGPSIASIYYSFTDWSGLGPANFVGLANFQQMLSDTEFLQAFGHNLIWTAIFLTVPIAMGLLGAFLLSRIRRFQVFFRIVYFIPYMIASVVNSAVWEQILDPSQGIGPVLASHAIPFLNNIAFFGNERIALPSVAFVDNWHWWGFIVVVFLGAMQSVDTQLYDAARVDGANVWREFWHVTLPGIRPTLMFIVLMTVIWSLLVFDYVFIITQGGPAGSTQVLSTLLYQDAFSRNEAGYAAAIGLSMSVLSALITLGYLYLRRKGWEV